mmetsp:Transcript_34065/g.101805  ORF Transcript_34065/g.101805 Transcript_34065/m.101805 type:complete len:411 (+) Transcript_34065:950-2182(+)
MALGGPLLIPPVGESLWKRAATAPFAPSPILPSFPSTQTRAPLVAPSSLPAWSGVEGMDSIMGGLKGFSSSTAGPPAPPPALAITTRWMTCSTYRTASWSFRRSSSTSTAGPASLIETGPFVSTSPPSVSFFSSSPASSFDSVRAATAPASTATSPAVPTASISCRSLSFSSLWTAASFCTSSSRPSTSDSASSMRRRRSVISASYRRRRRSSSSSSSFFSSSSSSFFSSSSCSASFSSCFSSCCFVTSTFFSSSSRFAWLVALADGVADDPCRSDAATESLPGGGMSAAFAEGEEETSGSHSAVSGTFSRDVWGRTDGDGSAFGAASGSGSGSVAVSASASSSGSGTGAASFPPSTLRIASAALRVSRFPSASPPASDDTVPNTHTRHSCPPSPANVRDWIIHMSFDDA